MLIDSHSHLDFSEFDKDRDVVIKRAFSSGVERIINIGTNFEASKKSIELAEKYENIYATVSLHPIDVDEEDFNEKAFLDLAKHSKVVAIGETGLDYAVFVSDVKSGLQKRASAEAQSEGGLSSEKILKNKQKEVFKKLIKIAVILDKPIIIHSREADEDIISILKSSKLPSKKGVIHCFGRDYNMAKKFLDLGFFISYTGNITYNPQRMSSSKKVPLEKILVETDCPFMTPVPFRGQRNEPAYVRYIAEKIAEIKEISFNEVAEITSQNCFYLFSLS